MPEFWYLFTRDIFVLIKMQDTIILTTCLRVSYCLLLFYNRLFYENINEWTLKRITNNLISYSSVPLPTPQNSGPLIRVQNYASRLLIIHTHKLTTGYYRGDIGKEADCVKKFSLSCQYYKFGSGLGLWIGPRLPRLPSLMRKDGLQNHPSYHSCGWTAKQVAPTQYRVWSALIGAFTTHITNTKWPWNY